MSKLGDDLIESLEEVLAYKRGEIALPTRTVSPLPPARIKAIRKRVAKSPKEFERRFHVPARTMEGWEQGRRQPDPAAVALLRVIEKNPDAVEAALAD
ncbi:helix-turn-helix domain-containing protein [Ancylobacter oerskovii]|uniref:Helix-turn-helix domain-containing protein n=1 Tax=Ancylobacter oerskovii TaxID=459519 RepID=A0ABW4Z2S9_9HYPH|nr:transcriptional regulator [Ancylobacter oerskovii]MBS7546230.1 transcriptional regulator [Ancylobacter oerskovii]